MSGICNLCRCFLQSRTTICGDCEALLMRLAAVYECLPAEFSKLWQRSHCLGLYQPPLDYLLKRAKYHQDLKILKTLADLLVNSLQTSFFDPEVTVLPVPMSRNRFVDRGYNQAAVIAHQVAQQLALPYATDIVRHTGQSAVQHELGRTARLRNMHKAFMINKAPPLKVAVVDDIYTTGATMQAICRVLRRAGCEYIEIWIIAKTL